MTEMSVIRRGPLEGVAGARAVAAAQLSWWTERAGLARARAGLAWGAADGSGRQR